MYFPAILFYDSNMLALWACLGLCLGSFVNVVIHRWPRSESLLRPGSRCPHCRRPIFFYDNIPILSFLWLHGLCRHCRKPISWRYVLVEALMGALAVGIAWRWPGQWIWTALALCVMAALVAVAFIDWDTLLIPDALSLGLLLAGLLSAPLNPLFSGGLWARILASFLGALVGFTLCWVLAIIGEALFKKEALGGGDVKLLAAIGAWTGALGAFDCLVLASLAGSIYGTSLLIRKKIQRQDPIPFGPFLSAGAMFNFFYLLPLGFPFQLS